MPQQERKDLDAIELLMQDHREVESLFSEFEYLRQKGEDTGPVIKIVCAELKDHDALENDIFYPAVSDAAREEEIEAILNDAEDAHDSVLDLIEELEQSDTDAATRNARFSVLAEKMKQHILEEEAELFPRVRQLKRLGLDSLATQMKARKSGLMPNVGAAETEERV